MRYFFHIYDEGFFRDEDGIDLSGLHSAQKVAEETARSVMIQQIRGGFLHLGHRIEVEDEHGQVVYRLQFSDAVHVTSDT